MSDKKAKGDWWLVSGFEGVANSTTAPKDETAKIIPLHRSDLQHLQSGQRRAAWACHVEVRDYRELDDLTLFVAQLGGLPNYVHAPIAKMGFSLDDTASDEIGVRVGKIGGNAEHTPDRLGLLLENTERQLVAFLSVASHGF